MKKRANRFDSADSQRVQRFDFSRLSAKPIKTPQGFLRIPGSLTRIGVLSYKRADGSWVKELREPAEVFSQVSLDTLKGVPITDMHTAMVSPNNVKELSVGYVGDDVRQDGEFANGTITVQEAKAIAMVERGDRRELSPGYTCFIDNTPGVYNGERYDSVQRDIVYNHLAIGPVGWGRAGSEVSVHMDGGMDDGAAVECSVSDKKSEEIKSKKEERRMKIQITLDGVTYDVEVADALAGNFKASVAGLQKTRQDALDQVSTLEGAITAAEKAKQETEARLDAATDPKAVQKAVNARVELTEQARKIDPKIDTDGKTDQEVRADALIAYGYTKDTFDGKDDAFVNGVFAATLNQLGTKRTAEEVTEGKRSVGARIDGADEKPQTADEARQAMMKRNQDRYTDRLDATKRSVEV